MINLFVDTSYKSLFIALLRDDNLIDKIQIMSEFNFSEKLVPLLDDIFRNNNLSFSDLKKIFVVVGPGSFTGIRIGLTTCKILAYVLNIPLVSISSLEFMATTNVDCDFIVSLIDARHNMVFGGVYDKNGNNVVPDQYTRIDLLTNNLSGQFTFVTYDDNLISNYVYPNYDVCKVVSRYLNDSTKNCYEINPNYLKKTEAEEKYD